MQVQEQLEAASAAAGSTEQQLARVLADWRASVAQMAATQACLCRCLLQICVVW